VRELCCNYFRELDRLLAEVVEQAGPEATIILASDHGFGAQRGTFFVNSWLEARGELAWSEGAQRTSDPRALGIGQLARHTFLLDWEKTRAYAATPSSNGIHIVVAEEGQEHGVPADEYHGYRATLARELLDFRPAGSAEPIVTRVWNREEIFAGPFQELAPDLTLELNDGGLVSILPSDTSFKKRDEPSGTHRPEGVFIGRGPGWRRGVAVPVLSILDVAPLLLHALGLEVPADMEGRVRESLFEPGHLETRPVRCGPPSVPASPTDGSDEEDRAEEAVYTEDDERLLAERLRALGYIN
jgi:predicted AlkP superfamily phosphohydrolase/phosphomutase